MHNSLYVILDKINNKDYHNDNNNEINITMGNSVLDDKDKIRNIQGYEMKINETIIFLWLEHCYLVTFNICEGVDSVFQ